MNTIPKIPTPVNEPILSYVPGSAERAARTRALKEMSGQPGEIPIVIGGREIRPGRTASVAMPHCHQHILATVHQAGPAEIEAAIAAAREAWRDWSAWPFERRAAVFLKAADLLATRLRAVVNAATMLGQSKTAHQAEIDAACELVDFWRFNVDYAGRILAEQPLSAPGAWNQLDHRPLEGFVYAITPFNFTSIGGNLPTAPAIIGCTVRWKPAASAVYSNYYVLKVLETAGLPPGVVNFVPGPSAQISERLLADRHLGGIHFTGSTDVFQSLWKQVAQNLTGYADYPRLVGETGGKDFIVAHPSADADALATALVRGAYEYQGQKCSAASRAYVPDTLWPKVRDRVLGMLREIRVGDPCDFRNFMGAGIDRKAFDKIKGYVEGAKADPKVKILFGGGGGTAAVGGGRGRRTKCQGRLPRQPAGRGVAAHGEGDVPPAAGLPLSVHGRAVNARRGGARPPLLVLLLGAAFLLLVAALLIGSFTRPEFPPHPLSGPLPARGGGSPRGPATRTLDAAPPCRWRTLPF